MCVVCVVGCVHGHGIGSMQKNLVVSSALSFCTAHSRQLRSHGPAVGAKLGPEQLWGLWGKPWHGTRISLHDLVCPEGLPPLPLFFLGLVSRPRDASGGTIMLM